MDLSKLTPQQQAVIFNALKSNGQQPTSGGQSTDVPDLNAQNGYATTAPQEGVPSGVDPVDHIAQSMGMQGPQAPNGVSLATGPQITQNVKADGLLGLLGRTVPGNSIQVPEQGIIQKLFGMKQTIPVNGVNYYDAARRAGLERYLPSGLAQMPDGTPFVGPETMQKALESKRVLAGQGETYSTLDQLTSQGLDPDEARKMLAANPNGVSSKEVGTLLSKGRLDAAQQMANARSTMAGVAKMGQLLKVGGFDAAQEAAKKAVANLGFAERAQAAIDQIMAAGGIADQRQRAELATSIAGLAGNGASVVTDDKMNKFLPDSARGKFNNVVEYWTNERQPVDFTGFLPQLQDLLLREKDANKGIANGAASLGIDILGQSQPKTADMLRSVRRQNSLVGTPASPVNPIPVQSTGPHFNSVDDVKSAYQAGKLTVDQAKALVKAMHKGK